MKIKYLLLTVIISLFSFKVLPYSTGFSNGADGWNFYGNGLGEIAGNSGRENPDSEDNESLWLSSDWGENHTAYFQWRGLKPGKHRVIFYLKAQDLQLGPDGVSIWNFHDGGEGTVTSVANLTGTFNWRRIQYEVNVKKDELTLWFRLKGPGQVWIDDFSLEPAVKESSGLLISSPEEEKKSKNLPFRHIVTEKKKQKITLFSFDKSEKGHPFPVRNKSGEFKAHKFYDFDLDDISLNWKNFDRIEMDIFNPSPKLADFNVTLADDFSRDYWSQTNHKQTLAPGWNKVGFSLKQTVGERGSNRSLRSVNLDRLKKFYIIVDPDRKQSFDSAGFLIDNIQLSSNPPPRSPAGVWSFDFTSHKSRDENGMIKVNTQTLYSQLRGYGFSQPQFWKVEDSLYTSEVLRYSIGLLKGSFKVNLPNGKYHLSLIMDKLGYWDVPFWKERSLWINGKIVQREVRGNGQEFLKDLLQFENTEPGLNDNPYELYLKKIFKPIEHTVEVTDGTLELSWTGDESAVSLNTLVVWSAGKNADGRKYLAEIEQNNLQEFGWQTRPMNLSPDNKKFSNPAVSIVEASLALSPGKILSPVSTVLSFSGGIEERPYQVIQFSPGQAEETVRWEIKSLINEKGEKLSADDFQFNEIIYQYTSPDLNHETYTIAGKVLRKIHGKKITLKSGANRYLWIQLPLRQNTPKGSFSGEIVFVRGNSKFTFPIVVNVYNYSLPKLDFPVGFMGLDPLPHSYYSGKGYNDYKRKFRILALQRLADAGFNTFSGLPEVHSKVRNKKIELDFTELDELFSEVKKMGFSGPVFSYGGKFPQSLIESFSVPENLKSEDYIKLLSTELQSAFIRKNWPEIVYTFSDEAAGYSDQVKNDVGRLSYLKKNFPKLALGGFGSFKERSAEQLNKSFDYGFYSSIGQREMKLVAAQRKKWGLYNVSPGNFDDPRTAFGPVLYFARKAGMSHYLEWNSAGFNNYPYYELDGREADVVIFYPSSDGGLHSTIRFELAAEGLQFYRKLFLLEKIIQKNKAAGKKNTNARKWLDSFRYHYSFSSTDDLAAIKKIDFKKVNHELNQQILQAINS